MSDEYEIVSRQELNALKREVQELKARPTQPPSADLMQAIDRLSHQIRHLVEVFEHANQEMATEPQVHTQPAPTVTTTDNTDKLDLVIAQNDQLAEGMVHLSDLLAKQRLSPQDTSRKQVQQTKSALEQFTQPHEQNSLEMPGMPHREGFVDSAPRADDEVFSSASMQAAGPKELDLAPPPYPRRAQDEDDTGLGDISEEDQNIPQQSMPETTSIPPSEPETTQSPAPTPDPADEQMPSLPPPPSLEEAMKSAPVPTAPVTKHSRKSLINSFR